LKDQQDLIAQLERVRLSQPGDITMVEHASMPKPTSYVREELQRNVVTVDNRVGAPEHARTHVDTSMKAAPAVVSTTTTTQAANDAQAMAKATSAAPSTSSSSWTSAPVMGSTAVGNSMMGQKQTTSSNTTSSSMGGSGLGYHPLTPEGITKATYASDPYASQTTGPTTGEKVKASLEHAKDVVQSKIEGTSSNSSYPASSAGMGTTAGAATYGSSDYTSTSGPTMGEKIKTKLEHAKDVVVSKVEGTSSSSAYPASSTGTTYPTPSVGATTATTTTTTTGDQYDASHPSLGERIKAKFEHMKDSLTPGHTTSTTSTTQTKTNY